MHATKNLLLYTTIPALFLGFAATAAAHGLVQDPPARNWFCGAITKPDHVLNGVAQYPECGDAFDFDWTGSYNFMSVLTHTQGRAVLGPRANVCGYNSENWAGGQTPWDQPINWPTNNIASGPKTFTWNISWGPHFSDTQEFRYWITRPGFQFQVGVPLSFSDFEEQPFCTLTYDDANPTANPNVVADKVNTLFHTTCNVPARSGRHVIYAEWGRNFFTFERFHGCIDVVFQGGPVVDAVLAISPNVSEFTGGGQITLDARGSTGSGLTYLWSIDAQNPGLYTIASPTSALTTLTLTNPQVAANFTINLLVSSGAVSGSATRIVMHRPSTGSQWFDLGPLTSTARTLLAGDRVAVRTVAQSGQDTYWPANPLVLTAANAAANMWPPALAQAINALNGTVRVGVLNAQDQVVPANDATSNRVYAQLTANMVSAFLQVNAVPQTPAGLVATAGNAQVQLAWNASGGATSYTVKRGTASNGPFTVVATGLTGTTYTNTGLTNGTAYTFVVSASNASGESANSTPAGATPTAPNGNGGVTVTPAVTTSSPWYNEQVVRLNNTGALSALSVTIVVQRTTGIALNGLYNTVGSQIQQNTSVTASTITYTFQLAAGQSLGAGTNRTFAAQMNGTGTAHPTAGDTYTVTYTSAGQSFTQSGTF